MRGRIQGDLKYKADVTCNQCKKTESSSTTFLRIGTVEINELEEAIKDALRTKFIEPPIYWSIAGRGNYTCWECNHPNTPRPKD